MTDNVVKFPYDACRRVHSRKPRRSKNGTPEERAAKAAADAAGRIEAPVVQLSFRGDGVPLGELIEKLPREEKHRIAAELQWQIEQRSHTRVGLVRDNRRIAVTSEISLKKQRDIRYEAWGEASAATHFFEALCNFYDALFVAQRSKLKDALQFEAVDLGDAKRHAAVKAWRDATARQLLTPAPNTGAVLWKKKARTQNFSCLPSKQVEKAIAEDEAWLKRRPASDRRRLR